MRRATAVLTNAANSLALPLLTPVLSLLVIRLASAEVWGEFVGVLLVVQLGMHVIGWGNKEYLLREFSRSPAQLAAAWQTSIVTRGLLLVPLWLALLAWAGPGARLGWMVLWTAALLLDQACEVLVTYTRAFALAFGVDAAGLALTALAVVGLAAGERLTADALIIVMALVTALQAAALVWRFRRQTLGGLAERLRLPLRAVRPGYFGAALPFFLLGLSGMLQSRVDLYAANALLPRADVGHYQVLIGFLLYLQAVANVLLLPFVKSLYRMQAPSVPQLAARLGLVGLIVVPIGILGLRWLLGAFYGLALPAAAWAWGGLLAWPAYLYLPLLYWLYRLNRPRVVLGLNLLGTAISAGLSVWLLPRAGIGGGLAAAAAAQWAMLGAYLWLARQWRPAADAVAVPDVP